jgi:hypothetical protein
MEYDKLDLCSGKIFDVASLEIWYIGIIEVATTISDG